MFCKFIYLEENSGNGVFFMSFLPVFLHPIFIKKNDLVLYTL